MKLQLNQNYTARQRGLLSAFKKNGSATVGELLSAMEAETGKSLTSGAVTNALTTLANKLAQDGYIILRKSKLGRGHKGFWSLVELNSDQSNGE